MTDPPTTAAATSGGGGTFYVTTPIYYVNDKPHLGHVYTTMVADVVARYHRLRGDDTFFLTGVDEHAAKVADKAAEHGKTPQEWADLNAAQFRGTFEKLEMTNDDFVRTSSDHHKQKVTEYVAALIASDDIYPGTYEGWYDAGQEEYVPDNKAQAQDYKSEVNGKPLVKKSEKNYFFRLSKYVPALLEHFEANPQFVQPDARRNEIVNRIKEAQDVPISRTGSGGWGIPVPGDEDQTIYVWIDALFNYLTYVDRDERRHYWTYVNGPDRFQLFASGGGATHFIAKDILWFHAAIWPGMLLALQKCPGYEWLNLPGQVYSHSYWVSESGEKMSKSLGNFLDPAAIDNYVEEFGLDALRYFLATRGPLGTTDSAFSPDLFIEVYNADLANTFGNSVSRVTNMIGKYFGGVAPSPGPVPVIDTDTPTSKYVPPSDTPWDLIGDYETYFELLRLDTVAEYSALCQVNMVDIYIEKTQPFKLAKDPGNLPMVGTILYNCVESLRIASLMLWPFIPDACEKFWSRIGCDYAEQMRANGGKGKLDEWVKWGRLEPSTPIEKGEPLFPRYQVEKK
ncbi:MAG: methionine--tRNA ligase [Planctomycetota bacterium]